MLSCLALFSSGSVESKPLLVVSSSFAAFPVGLPSSPPLLTAPPFAPLTAQVPEMLATLAMLVNADKLRINYTEYELSTEFTEALEHASEEGRNTKVILKMNDVGITG